MVILGIDPGLANVGWAILDNRSSIMDHRLVDWGVVETDRKDISANRLAKIYEEIGGLIKKHRVEEVAIENLFFAKNAKSAIKVAEVIGVIKVCGCKNELKVFEYTPLQVKMALVGYGRAEKGQVEIMVRQELGLEEAIRPSHASDAVAVALIHGFSSFIREQGMVR